MIEFLSNWIEGIAIAVIIVSIIEMILPKGNVKKYIKVVLGIYVVFSIISPFVDNNVLYSFDFSDVLDEYSNNITNTEVESSNNEQDMEKIYIDTLESEIIKTIEKQGYNVKSCNVDGVFDTTREDAGIKKIEIVLQSKKVSNEQEDEKNSENGINPEYANSNIEEVNKVEINVNIENSNSNDELSTGKEITNKDINSLKKYLSEYYEIDSRIISIS